MSVPSDPGARVVKRRASPWVWPLALALALVAWHVWDLAVRRHGTGLRVALVSAEEARARLTADPRAIAIDVRLHGTSHPLPRMMRVPYMQLGARIGEMGRYRRSPVFIVAASEEQGISAAAMLARRDFARVAVVRAQPTARARAHGSPPAARALTSKDGLISLNGKPQEP